MLNSCKNRKLENISSYKMIKSISTQQSYSNHCSPRKKIAESLMKRNWNRFLEISYPCKYCISRIQMKVLFIFHYLIKSIEYLLWKNLKNCKFPKNLSVIYWWNFPGVFLENDNRSRVTVITSWGEHVQYLWSNDKATLYIENHSKTSKKSKAKLKEFSLMILPIDQFKHTSNDMFSVKKLSLKNRT